MADYANSDSLKWISRELQAYPKVNEVDFQKDLVDQVNHNIVKISIVLLVLAVLLTFVSFFIMSNTIKLTTYGRREEIAIMKMVGATNAFIRTPFVIEGLILGLLGGFLGFLAVWGLYTALTGNIMNSLTGSFLTLIPFRTVMLPLLVAFLGIGVLIGVFGGVNAIRNYLKV